MDFFFFFYNQSNRSQGDSRRAREVAIHWDVPDLNSIQSWGGKLDVMQSASRSGRTPTRVTRVPHHTLVWAKGSRHSPAAPLQRQTRFIPVSEAPTFPQIPSPKAPSHLMSCWFPLREQCPSSKEFCLAEFILHWSLLSFYFFSSHSSV